jgi:serine protease
MSGSGLRRAAAGALLLALAVAAPAGASVHRTGRYLVVLNQGGGSRASAAVLSRAGVRLAGRPAPKLGVEPVRGSLSAIRALRRDPAVKSVSPEYTRDLRFLPNDPALTTPETEFGGIPGGGPIEWWLQREDFPRAWDVTTGNGAVVGVVDSGIDGSHPELAGKIASAEATDGTDPRTDPEGHGTHVSGLACAATGNGIGVAGAGFNCRLALVKVPSPSIPDLDIVNGIRTAADRGAQAINMSFGGGPPSDALDAAINYAVQKGVVLVAAASNNPDQDQGAPASQLQPGDAPNIDAGRGLVVTAADFSDQRAGTGLGPQVSLAAYGFFSQSSGPPGLVSTYPGTQTPDDVPDCTPVVLSSCLRKNIGGDNRYAYLQGTSMATPQVTALAALVAHLNPFLSLQEKMRLIKATARRGGGGWTSELGWGIIDAFRAVDAARRVDHVAPSSKARAKHRIRVKRGARRAAIRVRWSGSDPAGAAKLIPSGVRSFDLYMRRGKGRYRGVRRATRNRSAKLRLGPGVYRFYTRARDAAGNLEAAPRRADVRLVVLRPLR